MKYWFLGLVCIAALIMCICIGYCKEPAKQVNNSDSVRILQNQIAELRAKANEYKPQHFRDTLIQYQTVYRNRLHEVERWVFNTTRNTLCDSFANGDTGETCQRVLARRLIRCEYYESIIPIYQEQRTEDSLQIGVLMKLDSLNSELNTKHVSEAKRLNGEIIQLRKENRSARLKGGLFGFVGGVLIGMFL